MRHVTPGILMAVCLSLMIGSTALGHKDGDGDRKSRWTEKLDLTEAQQAELDKIKESHGTKMKEKRKAMKEAKRKLGEALKTDASEDMLWAQFKQLQQLKSDFGTARFEKILAIRKILTPEQRAKFNAMKRHHRRHKKHKD